MLPFFTALFRRTPQLEDQPEFKWLQSIPDLKKVRYKNNAIIFKVGDIAEKTYVIVKGKVRISWPHKPTELTLDAGALFGEMAVLNDRPRDAKAVAVGKVILNEIPREGLLKAYTEYPELAKYFSRLQETYDIPLRGSVEQYVGKDREWGKTISNYYKNRKVMATYYLDHNLFSMVRSGSGKVHTFGSNIIEVEKNRLVRIWADGKLKGLPELCQALLNGEKIEKIHLENFKSYGELRLTLPKEDILCECLAVTRGQLQEAIDKGAQDLKALEKATGAGTICRGCVPRIMEMLGFKPWLKAKIQRSKVHSDKVHSFIISPLEKPFHSFLPGQFIILKVEVEGHIYERPYSLSDILQDGKFTITVKREKAGQLTEWLFNLPESGAEILCTESEGEFIFDLSPENEALCFAGGIGITPFLPYVKTAKGKKITIHYSANQPEDFIFQNEFSKLDVSIEYSTTWLTPHEVQKIAAKHPTAEIYICGPEGFVNLVYQALLQSGVLPSRVHFEKYLNVKINA